MTTSSKSLFQRIFGLKNSEPLPPPHYGSMMRDNADREEVETLVKIINQIKYEVEAGAKTGSSTVRVRFEKNAKWVSPIESYGAGKHHHIRASFASWLKEHGLKCTFDSYASQHTVVIAPDNANG